MRVGVPKAIKDAESRVALTTAGARQLVDRGHAVTVERDALWNGRRVPLAGTVCMDQALVDLGPAAAAAPGDELVLLGGDGQLGITAEDWAQWLDTISYEVVCGFGARVPRMYVDAADRDIDEGVPA